MSRRIQTLARNHPLAALAAVLAAGLAFGLAGCDASSPSEPPQQPGTPPGGGPGSAAYNITVTLSPPEVPAGSPDPVQVTVRVVRADTGQPPPTGTTIIVSASGGAFGSADGPTSVVVQTTNGQAVVSYFPPLLVGTGSVIIQARLESSIGQATLRIAEPETFFVASVAPSTGSPNGGEEVTIHGGGFESPVRVTFGGVPAQVLSVSSNRIRVLTPPSADPVPVGGTLPVAVTVIVRLNEVDQAVDSLPSAFIYSRGGTVIQPQVFSVTPASGPNEGGTRVTINGEGFQAPVQVFFGSGTSPSSFTGIEATVESVSANRIVVRTPAATGFGQNNLNQVVSILVKNLDSGFSTIAGSAFQYGGGGDAIPFISAISPGGGPYTGGTLVTLFGQGFDEPVAVSIGGIGQAVISVTGTEVVIRTGGVRVEDCDVVSENPGTVSITNIETGESAEGPAFEFIVPQPLVTGVSPSSGPQAGGTAVTISGQGFEPPVRVRFVSGSDGFSATVTSASSTTIGATTPQVPNSALDEESCDDNADGTVGRALRPHRLRRARWRTSAPVATDTFEGAFTYIPTDQSCRGDVGGRRPRRRPVQRRHRQRRRRPDRLQRGMSPTRSARAGRRRRERLGSNVGCGLPHRRIARGCLQTGRVGLGPPGDGPAIVECPLVGQGPPYGPWPDRMVSPPAGRRPRRSAAALRILPGMKRPLQRSLLLASVCFLAASGLSCDSAIPTAPGGTLLTISANPSQITLNGVSTVTVVGRKPNGSPLNEGTEIFFSTSLGSINPAVVAVDEDGVARTSLRGDGRVGTANIQARVGTGSSGEGGTGTATIEVQIGRTAGAVSIQATPSSVPETGGSIALLALVRDDQGQPLAGVSVNFQAAVGRLQSGGSFITTNAQGEARDTLSVTAGDLDGVAGDSFSVGAEAAAGGGVQSDTATISILRLPEADFGFTPNRLTVSFEDRSSGNPTSWFWDFGDTQTSTSRNPTHTYGAEGSFTVTLRARNSVGEDTTSRVVTVSASN
jgi:hypothetical protein